MPRRLRPPRLGPQSLPGPRLSRFGVVGGRPLCAHPPLDLVVLGRGWAFEGFAVHLFDFVWICSFRQIVVARDRRPVSLVDALG